MRVFSVFAKRKVLAPTNAVARRGYCDLCLAKLWVVALNALA